MNGEVSTVCRVKDPSCVAVNAEGTIVVGTPNFIYRISKLISGSYEAVVVTPGDTKEKKKEKKESKTEHSPCKPLGIAVHDASNSCFVSESHSVRKITLFD
eukprot:Phypoly_transcript_12216.p2 GENE.Phypoly_transcript_12216~~Phypoly_transcript_12216.p2  ORF type:complete len:101 (+),score=17.07 Phypoly_transcript_12216:744-1046(+)